MIEERTFLWIFYIVALTFVFVSLATFMQDNLAGDNAFRQKFLSKDFALAHDAMLAVSGNSLAEVVLDKDREVVLEKRENCEFIVDGDNSKCAKGELEEEKRYIVTSSKIVIESNDKEVSVSG